MTERPVRIQCKRTKGWRMPPNTVYVGRPTCFGNPFVGEPEAAVAAYRAFLSGRTMQVSVGPDQSIKRMEYIPAWHSHEEVLQMVPRLRGKNLACWCPLDQPCHADVLLELANLATPANTVAPEPAEDRE